MTAFRALQAVLLVLSGVAMLFNVKVLASLDVKVVIGLAVVVGGVAIA